MTKIIHFFINKIGTILKRKILLIPTSYSQRIHAVKSKGGFWYCGNLYDTADIAYGITINGSVEEEETILVEKILKQFPENYTLLDIGANTGYYGIMSAHMFPSSRVYSFEPIQEHCDLIHESAYLNKISNIDINQYALGNTDENTEIYYAGSGTTLIEGFTKSHKKVKISVKKLDDVVKEKDIQDINFIKIDVEGFELEVLKGAKETLNLFKPVVFSEICHTKDGNNGLFKNENFNDTINFMENLGYKTQILIKNSLIHYNKNTPPLKGVWMFLFVHSEKHKHIIL